jgi:hypothetical protein
MAIHGAPASALVGPNLTAPNQFDSAVAKRDTIQLCRGEGLEGRAPPSDCILGPANHRRAPLAGNSALRERIGLEFQCIDPTNHPADLSCPLPPI